MIIDDFTPPQWLEKYRLDDQLRADAYENSVLDYKAGIKSALALHFNQEEERYPTSSIVKKNAFCIKIEEKPCEVSLFIVGKSFVSSAQFISSVLPALLAKSPVCVVFREEPSDVMMLTLELMGLESVFLFPKELANEEENLRKLCSQFQTNYNDFPTILLGRDDELEEFLFLKGIRYQSYFYEKPVILSGTQEEYFSIAYPTAQIVTSLSELYSPSSIDIASSTSEEVESLDHSMPIVGAGLEWYMPFIFSTEFFVTIRKTFSFVE